MDSARDRRGRGIITESGTAFVSSYYLPSNEAERDRLNGQSRYMTRVMFDGKLIYVPISLLPRDEVLEVATGTGVWLLDLARNIHPTITLTGIDIQPRLFPMEHPTNISFGVHSVTNLPDSWTDRFKLVNQRLLNAALTTEQWGLAFQEIYRVIIPGGWIQLLETGPEPVVCSGPNMRRLLDALEKLYVTNRLFREVQYAMHQLLAHAGFIHVERHTITLPRPGYDLEEYQGHKKVVVSFFAAAKESMLSTGQFESGLEFDRVVKGMDSEWEETSQCLWNWTIAYAQKPKSAV